MSPGTGGVLIVGSINVDRVVRVDHWPRPGETVIGGRFDRHGGGTGLPTGRSQRRGSAQPLASSAPWPKTTSVTRRSSSSYGRGSMLAACDE
jgi:hypothetical protein